MIGVGSVAEKLKRLDEVKPVLPERDRASPLTTPVFHSRFRVFEPVRPFDSKVRCHDGHHATRVRCSRGVLDRGQRREVHHIGRVPAVRAVRMARVVEVAVPRDPGGGDEDDRILDWGYRDPKEPPTS